MKITPIKKLTVGIVPSWLNQLIVMSKDIDYPDLLCYDTMKEKLSRIVTDDEVLIYVITQEYLDAFTGKAFSDQTNLSQRDDNFSFIQTHEEALSKVSDKLKIETGFNAIDTKNPDAIAAINFLAKEYYQPFMVDSEHLLLIGSATPVYENNRAFYNALVETVSESFTLAEFKRFELFKHYLRNAVSN